MNRFSDRSSTLLGSTNASTPRGCFFALVDPRSRVDEARASAHAGCALKQNRSRGFCFGEFVLSALPPFGRCPNQQTSQGSPKERVELAHRSRGNSFCPIGANVPYPNRTRRVAKQRAGVRTPHPKIGVLAHRVHGAKKDPSQGLDLFSQVIRRIRPWPFP